MVASKAISRIDAPNDETNLRLVAIGRVDFSQMNASSFNAFNSKRPEMDKLVGIPVPGEPAFTRHILIGKGNPALAKRLHDIVEGMQSDPQWKAIARRHGLDVAPH